MIEHTGIVEKLDNGRITIAIRLEGCASCGHGSECGMAKLARLQKTAHMDFAAPAGVQIGDQVTLAMPESGMHHFALLGYLLPALALVIGAALGSAYGGSDVATALGAFLGFLLSLLIARPLTRRLPTPQILPTPSSSLIHGVSP